MFLNFELSFLCAYYSLLQYESTITICVLLMSHVSNWKGKYIWSNLNLIQINQDS